MELIALKEKWVDKSLGDITSKISSGNSSTKNTGGRFPIYGSTGIIGYSEYADYNGANILVARVGANAGKTSLVTGEYCVSDNTSIVTPSSKLDITFGYFQLVSKKLNNLVFGSGQPLITGSVS